TKSVFAENLPLHPLVDERREIGAVRQLPVLGEVLVVAQPLHIRRDERAEIRRLVPVFCPARFKPPRELVQPHWPTLALQTLLDRTPHIEAVRARGKEAGAVRRIL